MGTTTGTLRQGPATVHAVRGGGGLRLHVREWGRADGRPILFLHGWSQSHLCWAKQYQSALAEEFRLVACDLRGHGMSEAPPGPGHYTDGRLWADDLAAIGAIDFAGAATTLGEAAFGTLIGPDFFDNVPDATADDLPTNIRGMRALVQAFPAKPLPPEEVETLLGSSMTVPARIRAADTVILPAMAEHILTTCPVAEPSWYDGIGHTTFLEDPDRFNQELAALTRRVTSTSPA